MGIEWWVGLVSQATMVARRWGLNDSGSAGNMQQCESTNLQPTTTANHVPSCRKTFHFLWLTRTAANGPVTPPYHTLFVNETTAERD